MKGKITTREMNIEGRKFINVWFTPTGEEGKLLLGDLNGALGEYFQDKFPLVYQKLKEGYEIIANIEIIKS